MIRVFKALFYSLDTKPVPMFCFSTPRQRMRSLLSQWGVRSQTLLSPEEKSKRRSEISHSIFEARKEAFLVFVNPTWTEENSVLNFFR
mmetsp:Transcript_12702/g.13949  ORF Transcript_12702/g.13949 Transcript_12702/m.13949 type:complete len:88 (+) Transcript_12702:79-342(+)